MNIEPSGNSSFDEDDVEGGGQEVVRHSLPPTSHGISRRTAMLRQRRQRRFAVGVILSLAVMGAVVALSVVLSRDRSSESGTVAASANTLDSNVDARSTPPATTVPTSVATPAPVFVTPPPSTASPAEASPTSAPSTNNTTSNVFQATPPPILRPTTGPPTPLPTTTGAPTASPAISASPTFSPTATPLVRTIRGSFEVLETVPHDTSAFTQGLEVLSWQRLMHGNATTLNNTTAANYMLESTGLYGQSTLRIVEIATGQVVESLDVDASYFAEGCTYYQMQDETDSDTIRPIKVVQLTWRSGTGFVYELSMDTQRYRAEDVASGTTAAIPFGLERVGTFAIDTTNGEGWGILYHPTLDQFIVSDGTDNIHFWELRKNSVDNGDLIFELVRTQQVTRRFSANSEWTAVFRLNELEWDPYSKDGTTILANVWQTDVIVRIRLEDGKVTHQYDMSSLDRQASADVLNGIAAVWDSVAPESPSSSLDNQFWVTGKEWDSMYRIRFDD